MVEPTSETPEGFTRGQRRSPFLDLVGELYLRDDANAPVCGLRIQAEPANNRGDAHCGVLMTLADLVLGYTTAFASDPPLPLTTASSSIDFVGGAKGRRLARRWRRDLLVPRRAKGPQNGVVRQLSGWLVHRAAAGAITCGKSASVRSQAKGTPHPPAATCLSMTIRMSSSAK